MSVLCYSFINKGDKHKHSFKLIARIVSIFPFAGTNNTKGWRISE